MVLSKRCFVILEVVVIYRDSCVVVIYRGSCYIEVVVIYRGSW